MKKEVLCFPKTAKNYESAYHYLKIVLDIFDKILHFDMVTIISLQIICNVTMNNELVTSVYMVIIGFIFLSIAVLPCCRFIELCFSAFAKICTELNVCSETLWH